MHGPDIGCVVDSSVCAFEGLGKAEETDSVDVIFYSIFFSILFFKLVEEMEHSGLTCFSFYH